MRTRVSQNAGGVVGRATTPPAFAVVRTRGSFASTVPISGIGDGWGCTAKVPIRRARAAAPAPAASSSLPAVRPTRKESTPEVFNVIGSTMTDIFAEQLDPDRIAEH